MCVCVYLFVCVCVLVLFSFVKHAPTVCYEASLLELFSSEGEFREDMLNNVTQVV